MCAHESAYVKMKPGDCSDKCALLWKPAMNKALCCAILNLENLYLLIQKGEWKLANWFLWAFRKLGEKQFSNFSQDSSPFKKTLIKKLHLMDKFVIICSNIRNYAPIQSLIANFYQWSMQITRDFIIIDLNNPIQIEQKISMNYKYTFFPS